MALSELPWRTIRRLIGAARREFWTVPKPDARGIYVPLPAQEVADRLQTPANFEDGWLLSYQYHGEDANLRRPAGTRTIDGEEVQMHLHARLFEHAPDNGTPRTEILPHHEPSPIQHPRLHLLEEAMSWEAGVERMSNVLDIVGLDYEVESPKPEHQP